MDFKLQPDTFYRCINTYDDQVIEYCAPDGSILVFARDNLEIPYPLLEVYALVKTCRPTDVVTQNIVPKEATVCERMSICWMDSSEFGVLMLVYPKEWDHSILEQAYGDEFRFMYSLADFYAPPNYEYYLVPGLGSLNMISSTCWFSPDSDTMAIHKLITRDFFGEPELYGKYGISDRELDKFFDCGEFHPWEDIEYDHCFYQYEDFIIYVSSRKDLAEGKSAPLWFEWNSYYNAYAQWDDCLDMIPALAKPLGREVTVGLSNQFWGSGKLVLSIGFCSRKDDHILYNVSDILTYFLNEQNEQKTLDLPLCGFFMTSDLRIQFEYWGVDSPKSRPMRELLSMLYLE